MRFMLLAILAAFAVASATGEVAEFEPQRFVSGGGRYRGKQFRVAKGAGASASRPAGYGGISRSRNIGAPRSTAYSRSYVYVGSGSSSRRYHSRGKRQNPTTKKTSAADWQFSTRGLPSFRSQFFNSDTDVKAGFEFRIALLRFLEFEDAYSVTEEETTSVLGYDASDVVGSEFTLVDSNSTHPGAWTQLKSYDEVINGVTVRTTTSSMWRETTTLSGTVNTTVALICRQSPSVVAVNGTKIAPNAMKFDVIIENFPYTLTGASGNVVKLGMAIMVSSAPAQARRRLAVSDDPINGEIAVGNDHGDGFGRFVWKMQADWWDRNSVKQITPAAIIASEMLPDDASADLAGDADDTKNADETNNIVVFTFDAERPQKVYWDPSVALDDELLEGAGAAVRASTAMVVLCALAALFAGRL